MKISRLEIALAVGIAVIWIWATVWSVHLGRVRGPFSDPAHSTSDVLVEELVQLTQNDSGGDSGGDSGDDSGDGSDSEPPETLLP